jgi:hypothetical protein
MQEPCLPEPQQLPPRSLRRRSEEGSAGWSRVTQAGQHWLRRLPRSCSRGAMLIFTSHEYTLLRQLRSIID